MVYISSELDSGGVILAQPETSCETDSFLVISSCYLNLWEINPTSHFYFYIIFQLVHLILIAIF